jgi:hypothetical protein
MAFDPLSAALELGVMAIDKIWPDPTKAAEEKRKLQELYQKGNLAELNAHVQLMLGQIQVNTVEAAHKSLFVAGWRPAVGWTCAISLALAFIPKAIVITILWAAQSYMMLDQCVVPACDIATFILPPFPDLGTTDLLGLLGGMLGIGVMRSIDKKNGTATQSLGGK